LKDKQGIYSAKGFGRKISKIYSVVYKVGAGINKVYSAQGCGRKKGKVYSAQVVVGR